MHLHTHYNTVIKPEVLLASETLEPHIKSDAEDFLKEEHKTVRNILGPKFIEEGYRLQFRTTTNQDVQPGGGCQKRSPKFYGNISRLPPTRLTNRVLTYITGFIKSTTPWVAQVENDLLRAKIDKPEVQDRNTNRNKIYK